MSAANENFNQPWNFSILQIPMTHSYLPATCLPREDVLGSGETRELSETGVARSANDRLSSSSSTSTRVATKIFEGFGEALFKELLTRQEPVSIVH